jgi:ubiquinone/menaquinone biosynthesis C-methylase UbiE
MGIFGHCAVGLAAKPATPKVPLGVLLSPERLAERLELNEAARVLELGPGPGYFSRAVARRIPRGYLMLADLQREMLQKASTKLARSGLGNVGFAQANGSALPVHSGELTLVPLPRQ